MVDLLVKMVDFGLLLLRFEKELCRLPLCRLTLRWYENCTQK